MDDLISRQAALDKAYELDLSDTGNDIQIWVVDVDDVKKLPTAEPRKGKWVEKKVIYKEEADEVIEEWQSCRCSECGRYDTRPYLYYFSKPRFCSWCGADMRGEQDG